MVIGKRNKKGDVTITTVILIVLGLAVLVMMIIGFTKGWSFFFDKFDSAPSDLQTFGKACVLYAKGGLDIDFCGYRLVGDEIINCKDSRFVSTLSGVDISNIECSEDASVKAAACNSLAYGKPNTKIGGAGGETCGAYLIASSCSGTPKDCNTFTTQTDCKNACTWSNDACSGTLKDCNTFTTQTDCKNACTWGTP
ncbi:hypothetical protein J4416_01705 [Candidatus Pacearchaeota archaeon]|nr:hypothetical protein [Candidatus Pacearchaeota archaeon]